MSLNSTTPTGPGSTLTPSTSTVTSISSFITTTTTDPISTTSIETTSSPPPITTTTTPEQITTTSEVDTPTVITSVATGSNNVVTTVTVTTTLPRTSSTNAATTTAAGAGGSLANGGSDGGGGSDSSSSARTIAPAVVVPVVVVALLILGGVWFFRRRRATKEAEELRRKEVEEYGFNPNTDPGFGGSAAAGMTATNDNVAAMSEADGSGYRGWGTTTNARKASTTLGSTSVGAAAIGLARSDSGENSAYHANGQPSPNGQSGTANYSDHNSGDPLMHQSRPISQDFEGVAALGAAPAAGSRNGGIHRGPSNASSAYSGGQRSDTSGEIGTAIGSPSWGNEYLPEDGPYGGPVGGAPVIRDVSARRNTRIEQPAVMPQQPRGGISQNF